MAFTTCAANSGRRLIPFTVLFAVAAFAVAGCGGSTTPAAENVHAGPTGASGASGSTSANSGFKPARTIKYGASYSDDGDTDVSALSGAVVNAELGFGPVMKADSTKLPAEFQNQFNGCAPTDSDAVIPVRVRATVDADAELAPAVEIIPGIGYKLKMDAAGDNGGRIGECETNLTESAGYETPSVRSDFPVLGPGEMHDRNWLFVVRDYYTSEYPDGQPNALSEAVGTVKITIVTSSGEDAEMEQTCYSGPREYAMLYRQGGNVMPGFSFTGTDYPGSETSDDEAGIGGYSAFRGAQEDGKSIPKC